MSFLSAGTAGEKRRGSMVTAWTPRARARLASVQNSRPIVQRDTMKYHPRSRVATVGQVYAPRDGRCGGIVRYGGAGALTTILTGGLAVHTKELSPLLGFLPEVSHATRPRARL